MTRAAFYGIQHIQSQLLLPDYLFASGDKIVHTWNITSADVPALYTTEEAAELMLLRFLISNRNYKIANFDIVQVEITIKEITR